MVSELCFPPGSESVSPVTGAGCHAVSVAAAGKVRFQVLWVNAGVLARWNRGGTWLVALAGHAGCGFVIKTRSAGSVGLLELN